MELQAEGGGAGLRVDAELLGPLGAGAILDAVSFEIPEALARDGRDRAAVLQHAVLPDPGALDGEAVGGKDEGLPRSPERVGLGAEVDDDFGAVGEDRSLDVVLRVQELVRQHLGAGDGLMQGARHPVRAQEPRAIGVPRPLAVRPKKRDRAVEDVEGILLVRDLGGGLPEPVARVAPVPGRDDTVVEDEFPERRAPGVADAPAFVGAPFRVPFAPGACEGVGLALRVNEVPRGPGVPAAAHHALDVIEVGDAPPDTVLAAGDQAEGADVSQKRLAAAAFVRARQGMLRVAAFVERLGGGDIDKPGEERNLRERLGDDGARGAFPESGAALHVLRLLVPGEPRGHALAVGLEDRRAGKLVVSGIDAPAALQGQDIGVVVVLAG